MVDRLDETSAAFGKVMSAEKTKLMANNANDISLSSKIRLMRSLVISVLLYACETWTLTVDILRKLQATEMRCFRNCLASHTET